METFNIYCDESCHLEFDNSPIMVLGAIWLPNDKNIEIKTRINEIKEKYGITKFRELKWTKLSPSLYNCYKDIIDYFFDDDDLHFRCLIVDNKQSFSHKKTQSYDDWYFKMYFYTLHNIIDPHSITNIYIDIKDTCSRRKIQKLHDVLCNSFDDFDHSRIKNIQAVRSESIAVMQIVDLLIGAAAYSNRKLTSSETKLKLIQHIQNRAKYSFLKNTLPRERKFNIFHLQLGEYHA